MKNGSDNNFIGPEGGAVEEFGMVLPLLPHLNDWKMHSHDVVDSTTSKPFLHTPYFKDCVNFTTF
jgi:hypothetical protein